MKAQILLESEINNIIDGYSQLKIENLASIPDNSIEELLTYHLLNSFAENEFENKFTLLCSKIRKGGRFKFDILTIESIFSINQKSKVGPELNELIGNINFVPKYEKLLDMIKKCGMKIDTIIKTGEINNAFSITR